MWRRSWLVWSSIYWISQKKLCPSFPIEFQEKYQKICRFLWLPTANVKMSVFPSRTEEDMDLTKTHREETDFQNHCTLLNQWKRPLDVCVGTVLTYCIHCTWLKPWCQMFAVFFWPLSLSAHDLSPCHIIASGQHLPSSLVKTVKGKWADLDARGTFGLEETPDTLPEFPQHQNCYVELEKYIFTRKCRTV